MSPEPTPLPAAPHGIEFTPITRGEPQRLPVSIALYYRVTGCYACGHGFGDLRRIRFDEVAGTYREDRLEAFFDDRGLVNSARISRDGQQIAFMVCRRGHYCGGEYAQYFPTPDAEQDLWISEDAGRTWKLLGPVLPGSVIVDMRDGDVLVEEQNYWSERHRRWSELSDEAWEAVLARLGGLGLLDNPEGWEKRSRWIVSGKEPPPGSEPRPPMLGGLAWMRVGAMPDGAIMWAAEAREEHLLAITDERGGVRRVYGAEEWRWGPDPIGDPRRIPAAATDHLLVRPSWTSRPLASGHQRIEATVELIDLATATIREVEGLTLPGAVGPSPDPARTEYYHFWAARPAPAATATTTPTTTSTTSPTPTPAPTATPTPSATPEPAPTPVPFPDPQPGRYTSISVGEGHTCALTEDGEAVCWGGNEYGQADPLPGRYTAISAGSAHTCAVTTGGEIVCWGRELNADPPPGTLQGGQHKRSSRLRAD